MSALRFEGVGVRLGSREILRGVDLELAPGEVLALVGPNGAGKTTLLRVASGVLRPSAGRALLEGQPLFALSRRELARRIAVVPQELQIAFGFSVGEVVLMGRSPHVGALGFDSGPDVEVARRALERVGIAELADRSLLELSGGERQLALVARAFAQEPRLLLLDEPTAHLDLRHRLEVAARVREFARGGRSALVVSHDLALAARSCDRMALLAGGRVLALGAPGEVLTPELLREGFGIEADVIRAGDGAPLVVPRAAAAARPPG